jgi:small multidrug resistance family-3 protein
VTLALYGAVASRQPSGDFGRVLAAYGWIFAAGPLLWGGIADGYRPTAST